uniref:Transmembrane protein 41B n=1 Tax=Mus musculus TaxID=10090 RepID=D6RDC1_MOUSE
MAKGRVADRSPTEMLHSTPAGDRAVRTQGSAAPGSKDHLNGKRG